MSEVVAQADKVSILELAARVHRGELTPEEAGEILARQMRIAAEETRA